MIGVEATVLASRWLAALSLLGASFVVAWVLRRRWEFRAHVLFVLVWSVVAAAGMLTLAGVPLPVPGAWLLESLNVAWSCSVAGLAALAVRLGRRLL